jgi:type I restriction enzyme, S subunit
MSFPPYTEYKDSGVDWLDEIPAHWEVERFKHFFKLVTDKAVSRTNPVALENIESWSGRFVPSRAMQFCRSDLSLPA